MKRLLILFMLTALMAVGLAQNKSTVIRAGFTVPAKPLVFTAADSIAGRGGFHIITSQTYYILVTNVQKYLQHCTFTTTVEDISGSPSVLITAYGKVNSGDGWTSFGTPVTWTTTGNNPVTITSTAPNNYNYLKLEYVASGAAQHTKILTFSVKTANVYDIGSASAYVFGDGTGTVTINSSDWDISTTGVMTGIGAITTNGLITGTLGATLTGAAINLNASSNFATNINTGSTNAALTLGGGSGTVAVNSSDWDITTTGAMTGIGAITTDGLLTAGASADITGTLGVSGVTTLTGGYIIPTPSPVIWAKGGSTVLATSGTDKACSNGARWWVEVDIPYNVTLTGLAYLVGSVGATDSVIVQLYNSAGTSVATSKTTGATHGAIVGTAAQFQSCPFTATYAAVAGKYYASVQFNGTTAKFRTYPIPGSKFITGTVAGTWDVTANITPGTSFTADYGPILMTY